MGYLQKSVDAKLGAKAQLWYYMKGQLYEIFDLQFCVCHKSDPPVPLTKR